MCCTCVHNQCEGQNAGEQEWKAWVEEGAGDDQGCELQSMAPRGGSQLGEQVLHGGACRVMVPTTTTFHPMHTFAVFGVGDDAQLTVATDGELCVGAKCCDMIGTTTGIY